MTPTEKTLSRLDKVHLRQSGQWSAQCPAHADKGPSLSVRESPNGGVLIHCFAGCTVHEIVGAMGMELHELFPPRERPTGTPKRIARLLTSAQALDLLADKSMLVAIAASNVANGVKLTKADRTQLLKAAGFINLLREQTKV